MKEIIVQVSDEILGIGDECITELSKVELIQCKDCRYFELNHFDNINGIPIITAHEICTKWGDGCKTSQDGYCFMAEREEQ